MSDDCRIDRIGLGALAERIGEGAHLRRIDDDDRQSGAGERGGNHAFEAAGCFDGDDSRRNRLQSGDELVETCTVTRHDKSLAARAHMHIELGFRDVDSNNESVHPVPSLSKRASHAAQATVRVRWNDGQRPTLSHGLGVPEGRRSSVHHRIRNNSGFGDRQVTRDRVRGSTNVYALAPPLIWRFARASSEYWPCT